MRVTSTIVSVFLSIMLFSSISNAETVSLPSKKADINQTSVSGLSSGAMMAQQLHVAYSDIMVGVGVVAGAPYYCAEGSSFTSIQRCMSGGFWWWGWWIKDLPDTEYLFEKAKGFEASGEIDKLSNIVGDKIYVFTGKADNVVKTPVMDAVDEWYKTAGVPQESIKYERDRIYAGHAFMTEDGAGSCSNSYGAYVNDCDYDGAKAVLEHIYGPLNAPEAEPEAVGAIIKFNQEEFTGGDAALISMDDTGYAYIPEVCSNESCKIHVVLHGCSQGESNLILGFNPADSVYRKAGYNKWAATNNMIMLYPQAISSFSNTMGCWDWWDYNGTGNYYAKEAPQMKAIYNMINKLAQ